MKPETHRSRLRAPISRLLLAPAWHARGLSPALALRAIPGPYTALLSGCARPRHADARLQSLGRSRLCQGHRLRSNPQVRNHELAA